MTRYRLKYRSKLSSVWNKVTVNAKSLEDAIRQVGYIVNRFDPFDNTNIIVVSEDRLVYDVYLEWSAGSTFLEVRYHISSLTFEEVEATFDLKEQKLWTWEVLNSLSVSELETIRRDKQDELARVKQEKLVIIGNILSLQEMISDELTLCECAKLQQEIKNNEQS